MIDGGCEETKAPVVPEEDELEEIFLEDEEFPDCQKEKYVVGFYEDEEILEPLHDRSEYNNWEVNEYLWSYFRFFGSKDMDIVYLCFLLRKKQDEVVAILGKSQPAVSYDMSRIRCQMDFAARLNASIDDFIIFVTDPNNGLSTYDREMLTAFFYTTSIVKTARLLKLKNVTCRSHIATIVGHLRQAGHMEMHELFMYIMSNLNNVKKFVEREECDLK